MFEIELIICIKMDLVFDNLQRLICHETQTLTKVCNLISVDWWRKLYFLKPFTRHLFSEINNLFLAILISFLSFWLIKFSWLTLVLHSNKMIKVIINLSNFLSTFIKLCQSSLIIILNIIFLHLNSTCFCDTMLLEIKD